MLEVENELWDGQVVWNGWKRPNRRMDLHFSTTADGCGERGGAWTLFSSLGSQKSLRSYRVLSKSLIEVRWRSVRYSILTIPLMQSPSSPNLSLVARTHVQIHNLEAGISWTAVQGAIPCYNRWYIILLCFPQPTNVRYQSFACARSFIISFALSLRTLRRILPLPFFCKIHT